MLYFLDIVERVSNIMYRYPFKSFIYLITLNMIYGFNDNLIFDIIILFIWNMMINCYAVSVLAKKGNSNVTSLDILNINVLTIKHFLVLTLASTLLALIDIVSNNLILELIVRISAAFTMTYGFIYLGYKQLK